MNNFYPYMPNDTNKALLLMPSYFECAKWTEELDNFEGNVDKDSWQKVYEDCFKFVRSMLDSEKYLKQTSFIMDWNNKELISQMGHDLWLTRNGHGTGFWDRPEIWGDCAELLSDLARDLTAQNCYVENDVLYFEQG